MDEVVLYFPNYAWKSKIGDLALKEDKCFTWFLCSKKYRDFKNLDVSIAEISKSSMFYNEVSGETLAIVKTPKLLILDKFDGNYERMLKKVKKKSLQGFVYFVNDRAEPCDADFICCNVKFVFLKGNLVVSSKQKFCPIIIYSKRNHKKIRSVVEEFPFPEEMDQVMEKFPCSTVSKVLYDMISEYFSKTKSFNI